MNKDYLMIAAFIISCLSLVLTFRILEVGTFTYEGNPLLKLVIENSYYAAFIHSLGWAFIFFYYFTLKRKEAFAKAIDILIFFTVMFTFTDFINNLTVMVVM